MLHSLSKLLVGFRAFRGYEALQQPTDGVQQLSPAEAVGANRRSSIGCLLSCPVQGCLCRETDASGERGLSGGQY